MPTSPPVSAEAWLRPLLPFLTEQAPCEQPADIDAETVNCCHISMALRYNLKDFHGRFQWCLFNEELPLNSMVDSCESDSMLTKLSDGVRKNVVDTENRIRKNIPCEISLWPNLV